MPIRRYITNSFSNNSVTSEKLAANAFNMIGIGTIVSTDSTYANTPSTPNNYVDVDGGYITILGSGFGDNANVFIDATAATSVTKVSNTRLNVQLPSRSAGLYNIYVVNTDGRTSVRPRSLGYSNFPEWITTSPLAFATANTTYTVNLSATGANNYALTTGSSLPSWLTLYSNGQLYSANVNVSEFTSYTFSIDAISSDGSIFTKSFLLQASTGAFEIFPAVNGKTIWSLQSDGALSLNTSGHWTITPFGDFTGLIKTWGGGGGVPTYGPTVYGGAGGYSTGKHVFASNSVYTLGVGSGGGGVVANRNSGGGAGRSGIGFQPKNTVNTHSVFFNATYPTLSGYYTTPQDSVFYLIGANNLTTSTNLTIEAWINLDAPIFGTTSPLIGHMNPGFSSYAWTFGPCSNSGNKLSFSFYTTVNDVDTNHFIVGDTSMELKRWYHVAFTLASGGTIKMFVDGVQQTLTSATGTTLTSNTTNSINNSNIKYLTIGQYGANTTFSGYASNLRITKQVLYSANFTPPTAALTSSSNTSLLTFQSNTVIDNSNNAFTLTFTGNSSLVTTSNFKPNIGSITSIIIAGGGGGGYSTAPSRGGAGGGNTAQAGEGDGGGAGTQSSAGAGGVGARRTGSAGSGANGGNGARDGTGNTTTEAPGGTGYLGATGGLGGYHGSDAGSGGGGSGYFGGGGGGGNIGGSGGGGGSGYTNLTYLANAETITGSYEIPGANTDANRGTAGDPGTGANTSTMNGKSGKIYIELA